MSKRRPWSSGELLLAFRLYCRMPFGRLHQHNPEIIDLAERIGRTPSAVAMKACNFASLDPVHRERGVTALGNVSGADRDLWARFEADPESIAAEAEAVYAGLANKDRTHDQTDLEAMDDEHVLDATLASIGETENERLMRTRRVQRFFRDAVLVSYEQRCALSGLAVRELLNASHIVPWNIDERRRADPRNGLCFNALYDRAFDRGLITFDESWRVVVSPALEETDPVPFHRDTLLRLAGCKLRNPMRFEPDRQALAWHREHVFRDTA